jgi:hypothetical protein
VAERVAAGRKAFYDDAAAPARPCVVDLPAVKARGGLLKKNPGASLVDLGDGVALVEFHSKMNTLGADAIEMMRSGVKEAASRFDALVVGNQGEQFSAGANLMLVLLAAQEEEWDELDTMVRRFQDANMALKYAEVPVVAAPFGLALGGGCEISLHAARVRASAETYMGLVEVGVGLIPAGGGTKEMARRALARAAGVEGADPFPFLKRVFETIAFARVSTSGRRRWPVPDPRRLALDEPRPAARRRQAGRPGSRPRRLAAASPGGDSGPGPSRPGHVPGRDPQRVARQPLQRARRAHRHEAGHDPVRGRPRAGNGLRAALPRPGARGVPLAAGDAEDPGARPAMLKEGKPLRN